MAGVFHSSSTNSTFFTTCCQLAINDDQQKCPGCRKVTDRLGFDKVLHILRNPHGFKEAELRRARLEAADRLEGLQDAYLNMRAWAEQNGLDTVARGNAACAPGVLGPDDHTFSRDTPMVPKEPT